MKHENDDQITGKAGKNRLKMDTAETEHGQGHVRNGVSRWQRYLAEFVGTFMLVFLGTGFIVVDTLTQGAITHLGIAFGFGLTVMFIIYTIGHISGAHINPAATLAFAIVRHFPPVDIIPYWVAQISGGIAASAVLGSLFGRTTGNLGATLPFAGQAPSLIIEIFIGFILMFVVVSVATDTRAIGEFAALAIGGTVATLALFAGPISGASLNPARSIGPALISGQIADLWIYLVGPPLGFVLGALVYQFLKEGRPRQPEIGFGDEEEQARIREQSAA